MTIVSSSILVQSVPLSVFIQLIVYLAVPSTGQLYPYKFTPRPALPPLNESVCTMYCHKDCEKFRYQLENSYTEDWGTRGLPVYGGTKRVSECQDANRRCNCGPRPDTFQQSHCNEYCWEDDCYRFEKAYGWDKAYDCLEAKRRCICGPKPLDVYRWPTEEECDRLCREECNNVDGTDGYNFCLNAKPKCKSCGVNPVIGWSIGLFLVFGFGFLSCYLCQRSGAARGPEAINVNLTPHPQVRGGGFLPVIPPTPVRPLTPTRPYEPRIVPRNPSPRPSVDPVRHPFIPAYPEPSAPMLPAASEENDLPPAYDDVIEKY